MIDWQPANTAPDEGYFVVWGPHLPDGMVVPYEAERFHEARKGGFPRHLSSACFTHWARVETPERVRVNRATAYMIGMGMCD